MRLCFGANICIEHWTYY